MPEQESAARALADDVFMDAAIVEATRALGRTHPNPAVGALIVREGRIVGRGFHRRVGLPHAEVEAIRQAGADARGATIYVTLEPHNHLGRTPPCTEAILQAGIARVVVGSIDPNPVVSGQGIARLRAAGLEVSVGVRAAACDGLVRSFAKHITTGLPFVVLKAATTLDGKLATATGDSKWVSGEEARVLVHQWRDELDAVLIGAGTALSDNPSLTTRLAAPVVEGREPRNPVRVVLAGSRVLPSQLHLWETAVTPTIVAVGDEQADQFMPLRERGVDIVPLPAVEGRVAVGQLLAELGKRGVTSLMVEGGAAVHGAFLRSGLVDELRLFLAPRIAGGDALSWTSSLGVTAMQQSWRLENMSVTRVGSDLLLTGRPMAPTG